MRKLKYILFILISCVITGPGCKEVYTPPSITTNPNILVVDGIILNGAEPSTITLSRTRLLADSVPSVKETNAKVSVLGSNGVEYPFDEQGNGQYIVSQLLLDTTQLYQLKIITSDGNEYRSDLSNVRTSPAIDSFYWKQDTLGVNEYVNTHDPSNNTKYYRWDFVETWEYRSGFNSTLNYVDDQVVFRPLADQIYTCYSSLPSSAINVTSTTRLSSDIVNQYQITEVPVGSEKISQLYSNLVRQYAISEDAFNFWQNLKKNTEQLGSLFDLQPFTEYGNIHCMNNPKINCLGFISFSSVQEKRIFISKGDVAYWNYFPYYTGCSVDTVQPADLTKYFPPGGPPYTSTLIGSNNGPYLLSSNFCVDCTYRGGTTQKPSYWP